MSLRIVPIAVALVALIAALPALAAEKNFTRAFQVAPGGRLNVNVDSGSIAVIGSDAQRVTVRMHARGSEQRLEQIQFSAEQNSTGVVVSGKRDRGEHWFGWLRGDADISVTVEVPRAYEVDLYTSGGNISVKQLDGAAIGRTSGGSINVESVRGEVRMRTSGGSVKVHDVQGRVEMDTSGGSIHASRIDGNLRGHTSGGGIRLERITGPIEASTSGGSISIELVGENQGIVARTSGGSITLSLPGAIKANLNASASGGGVSSELPVTGGESNRTSLRGTINQPGPEIVARTSGGSIRVSKVD